MCMNYKFEYVCDGCVTSRFPHHRVPCLYVRRQPSDGSAERAVVVTHGKNLRRTRATRKRPADSEGDPEQPGPSQKRRNTATDREWGQADRTGEGGDRP